MTNLPGQTYQPIGNYGSWGKPTVANGAVTLNVDEGAALGFDGSSGYKAPAEVTLSAELWIGTIRGAEPAYRGIGLGFWSSSGTVHATDHFTGLVLGPDGTLKLIVKGGTTAVASQAYAGAFDITAAHRLAYTVDTATGTLSNISLDGKAVTLPGTPPDTFKGQLANVGFYANSGEPRTSGKVANFSVLSGIGVIPTTDVPAVATTPPATPAATTMALAAVPNAVRADPPPTQGFIPSTDSVYQWSVRVGEDPLRRAYLWIPENCQRVRGVIIGVQNMLEQEIFADPTIRRTAAAEGLAIIWITPGDDGKGPETKFPDLLKKFTPPPEAIKQVQTALTDLANESGYAEIATAPLIATAHSAATPFVWGIENYFDAGRVAAIFPCKGWFTGHIRPGIPVFHIGSEYGEVGGKNWGETFLKDRIELQRLRGEGADRLLGEFVDIGAGHYEWNPACAGVVAMFIQKVARYRIPANATGAGPVALKPIDPKSGWLIEPAKLGTPEGKPVSTSRWAGDPAKAFWYLDEELASTVNAYMVAAFAKKPQVLTVLNHGKPQVDYSGGGVANVSPALQPDGTTFRVEGAFLDRSPTVNLYGGSTVGHAPGPILFKAGSGAIRQIGPDTFRIWMKRGGLVPQGLPWDPHIIAYQPGDKEFRRADRPVHPAFGTINKAGTPQTITFPKIADQRLGTTAIKLQASTDAGLPVQFYVVSGPVQLDPLDNSKLDFLKAPPNTKFPVRVIIGAYQWGRLSGAPVQNAVPLFQEFLIQK